MSDLQAHSPGNVALRDIGRRRQALPAYGMAAWLIVVTPVCANVQHVTVDFSRYSPSAAANLRHNDDLEDFIGMSTSDDHLTANRTAVVAISTFLGSAGVAELQSVAPSGREWHVRDVMNWAMQNSGERQLTAPELERVRQAVHDLPRQSSFPDPGNLVIVSFRGGSQWTTRCYDQRNPPDALRRIKTVIDGSKFVTIFEEQVEAVTAAKKRVEPHARPPLPVFPGPN
jgi:hypothetical protein